MDRTRLLELCKSAKIHACRRGYAEFAEDFSQWLAVKYLEGSKQHQIIKHSFYDFVRELKGRQAHGSDKKRAMDAMKRAVGVEDKTFRELIAYKSYEDWLIDNVNNEPDLSNKISNLNKREMEILKLFLDGVFLQDIGKIFDVTESRISQILKVIIFKIRGSMEDERMSLCPRCNAEKKREMYACKKCWFSLPKQIRDDIWLGYRENPVLWHDADRRAKEYWGIN